VKCVSAIKNEGIVKTWEMIDDFISSTQSNGNFEKNRFNQQKFWLFDSLNQKLQQNFYKHPKLKLELQIKLEQVQNQKTSSFKAADELYAYYLQCLKDE
jgi:LAO/AO transport system kinase